MSPAQRLRELLSKPNVEIMPGVPRRAIGQAHRQRRVQGHVHERFRGLGGAARPADTGLISFSEMLEQPAKLLCCRRKCSLIGDGVTGYGNALNVQRTVIEYARAGAAAVMIEDQVSRRGAVIRAASR